MAEDNQAKQRQQQLAQYSAELRQQAKAAAAGMKQQVSGGENVNQSQYRPSSTPGMDQKKQESWVGKIEAERGQKGPRTLDATIKDIIAEKQAQDAGQKQSVNQYADHIDSANRNKDGVIHGKGFTVRPSNGSSFETKGNQNASSPTRHQFRPQSASKENYRPKAAAKHATQSSVARHEAAGREAATKRAQQQQTTNQNQQQKGRGR